MTTVMGTYPKVCRERAQSHATFCISRVVSARRAEEALKLPGMDAFFKDCDSDKDDNVTWEELCAYLKRRSLEEHPAIPVGVMFYLLTQLLRKAITVKQFQAEMKVAYKKYRAQAKARLANTKKSSSEADSKVAEKKSSSSVADTI